MKKLNVFLVLTVGLWIIGFLFMFRSGGGGETVQRQQNNVVNNDAKNEFIVGQLQTKINHLELELSSLENKYSANHNVIQNLYKKIELERLLEAEPQQRKQQVQIQPQPQPQQAANEPSAGYESKRRKIYEDVKDLSYYVRAQLKKNSAAISNTNEIDSNVESRVQLILANLYQLATDGLAGEWRQRESQALVKRVQEKIYSIQNPSECASAKKILCDLNKACGFGCQVHHAMYCFSVAYANNRVLILESNNWRYNKAGFGAYFKPLSQTCTTIGNSQEEQPVSWNNANLETTQTIRMPIIDVITNRPDYLPLSVPKEFCSELSKLHGDPFPWWAGQMLGFMMRFTDEFSKKFVQPMRERLKFKTPSVGIHVRRTDKVGSEAAFHDLAEYMKHAKEYFDLYELSHQTKLENRTIYLATDEPSVLLEAKSKYKEYNFICDESNAKSARLGQRYTPGSVQGVILDVYFLSECDYLVCTFSSQVCRLAYELMQTRFPDAAWRFKSLDDVYYYGGQNEHFVEAIIAHTANKERNEIELQVGDRVGLAGNHWDGYSKGKNVRTRKTGLFPSYKVKDVIKTA